MSEVTVLMTVFNGMPYLAEAVNSILRQTLSDFEFVIVDDGSTDGTADFLKSLEDPRISIIHQENRGTAAAANHGLENINTRFVARMDADDRIRKWGFWELKSSPSAPPATENRWHCPPSTKSCFPT